MVSVLVTIDNTPPLDVAWLRLRVGDGKGEGLVQALLGGWLAHARSTPLQPVSGWVAVVLLWCRGAVFTRRHLLMFWNVQVLKFDAATVSNLDREGRQRHRSRAAQLTWFFLNASLLSIPTVDSESTPHAGRS